ncbi:hypothetical protein P691DRAFT_765889 [Macrolepiota fuliginosa MF-IS2]|uniref:Uncharacterized protein n=1 Tax=Macrolepiota fuliginosa MF-IS2 TaxID=1400762 RepID=A0A9P5X1W0_9AGAR|nr:hypothetical protein P691DRAFT_765889 [Macrolepiota fuliginosa MF-IS2]
MAHKPWSNEFSAEELTRLIPPEDVQFTIFAELINKLKFMLLKERNQSPTPIKVKENDNNEDDEFIDMMNSLVKLIVEHPSCNQLIEKITLFANMFNLIPEPHKCSIPPPYLHLHTEDVPLAPLCSQLHAEDVPPPLPCVLPHQNDDDVPMEAIPPPHACSEAAMQTPASLLMAPSPLCPDPTPAAVATLPVAAASIPKPGPKPRPLYASAAAKNLNPTAPPFHPPLHAPVPPAQAPLSTPKKPLKCLYYAMHGPSQCQFYIMAPTIPQGTILPLLVIAANKALAHTKSTLKVDSACPSPCGLTFAIASVPSTTDLDIIEVALSTELPRAQISIPVSQSFIKIMDVPFFKASSTIPLPSTKLNAQLKHFIIPSAYIVHAYFVRNSPKSEFATMWINLSDSQ